MWLTFLLIKLCLRSCYFVLNKSPLSLCSLVAVSLQKTVNSHMWAQPTGTRMETVQPPTPTVMPGITPQTPSAMTALHAKPGFCRTSSVTGNGWLLSTLFSSSSSSLYIQLVAVLSATTGGTVIMDGSHTAEDDDDLLDVSVIDSPYYFLECCLYRCLICFDTGVFGSFFPPLHSLFLSIIFVH